MVPAWQYLILSAVLFLVGLFGIIVRRNLIVVFMCLELMLNAANLAFITFARMHGGVEGQVIVFLVIVAGHELPGSDLIIAIGVTTVVLSILAHGLSANPLAAAFGARRPPEPGGAG